MRSVSPCKLIWRPHATCPFCCSQTLKRDDGAFETWNFIARRWSAVDCNSQEFSDVDTNSEVLRIAAFADGLRGGNPAGVLIADRFATDERMQSIAAEVGYSETAFAVREESAWRVRYFSPESEVPFCGHATIALGAALAMKHGNGVFDLRLNHATITVEGQSEGDQLWAALQSPSTRSRPATPATVAEALAMFGYRAADLDPRIPPAVAHGGADHLVLALASREALSAMRYELEAGRRLMNRESWVTIMLVYVESERRFHARNAFASGGVYEDPATGAAAAAFAGYLRDLNWPHGGSIDIAQGDDMGQSSRLRAELTAVPGQSIRVSGTARLMRA